jgi:hypothetical protein
MEGARPAAKEEKEIADASKTSKNLKSLFSSIVKDSAKSRRRLPKNLVVFGGQSFRLRIHLQFLGYCGMLHFDLYYLHCSVILADQL